MNWQASERNPDQLVGTTEFDSTYQALSISNQSRQSGFLRSIVMTALEANQPFLSSHIVKALNFHAIAGLHPCAGEYRPHSVRIANGGVVVYNAPDPELVPDLMSAFFRSLNSNWEGADDVMLAAWILWKINWVHPFVNGNGRTARAACYFALCVKRGKWLPGATVLPELLSLNRERCIAALRLADASYERGDWISGQLDLTALRDLLADLLAEQLGTKCVRGADARPAAQGRVEMGVTA